MNRNEKFIQKLNKNEKDAILEGLAKIKKGDWNGLDIKKLKGYRNYFRVRIGKIRIIFSIDDYDNIFIDKVGWRSDNTYNI